MRLRRGTPHSTISWRQEEGVNEHRVQELGAVYCREHGGHAGVLYGKAGLLLPMSLVHDQAGLKLTMLLEYDNAFLLPTMLLVFGKALLL